MRRTIRSFACAVGLWAALCAPAVAAPANGQLAAVLDDRLVALNPDGSALRPLAVTEPQITELAWAPDGNRLAIVHSGRISVLEFVTGRLVGVSAGPGDANPGWSADGTRIGFRRGLATFTVPAAGGAPPQLHSFVLAPETTQIAWRPDLGGLTSVIGGLLALPGVLPPPVVAGAPAYAPDGSRIAFANAGGVSTIPAAGGDAVAVTSAAGESPRWSPDGAELVYLAGGQLRTVALAGGAEPQTVPVAGRATAADWQPCVAGVTLSCRSVPPPRCSALTATATTEVDVAVELPAAACSDPSGRPLSIVVVRAPEHGTLAGWRYTPAAGFSGQDSLTYRVSNGATESELVRITILVTRRPPAPASRPVATPPPPVARAPFLTARATPRLDRRRRVLVRLSCDQDCSLTVRLEGRLRSSKRTFHGTQLKRSIGARRVLTVRLRLPSKPRGQLRTVWITGRVRNAAGQARAVRLPVRRPR